MHFTQRLLLIGLTSLPIVACSAEPGGTSDPTASDTEAVRAATANYLIADQFNNRVIEVDAQHNVVWHFGDGKSVASDTSIVGPNDASRVGSLTLIAGTGVPAGTPAQEPGCENGCVDNRVVLVNRAGAIVWQYGTSGITGAAKNQLNAPVSAVFLPTQHVLITDQGNSRVIEVDGSHDIVWQYGTTGTSGAGNNQLNNPNSAELLANGNVLIADENNNRVIEVNRNKNIVWSYGEPSDTTKINGAAFASRLPNGNTLISDANNNRIVEVNAGKSVVFNYVTSARPGSIAAPNPTRAVRLRNGHTLISDQNNHQVIEINSAGKIVFAQGALGVAGNGFNRLNAPYDAKVIGDFTGLTSPFAAHAPY